MTGNVLVRRGSTIAFAAVLLAALASPLQAQSDPRPTQARDDPLSKRDPQSGTAVVLRPKKRAIPSPITDRFYVRGTFYSPQVRTTIRVDPQDALPGVMGDPVSGEHDLGLSSRLHQPRIEFMFRLRERNKLRVDYFETNRSGAATLSRTIVFGNQTFLANDFVTSSLDWRTFGLTYTYSFLRNDRVELGAGLGVHFLEAEAHGAVPARLVQQAVSGAGAFPTIPIDFAWRISSRFALTARAQYLHAALNGFAGAMGDYHADVQYRWQPNFSLGLGYTILRNSLDIKRASFPGQLRLDVTGPEAFFRVSF